jgi:hypothetical protein
MKPKKMKFKFILFLFVKSKNQDNYVTEIAEEIAILTKSPNIRFYYGAEASVFTFSTDETLKSVKEFMDIILSEDKPVYFLLPYEPDNLSFGLPNDISSHLFGDVTPDKKSDINFTERKLSDFNSLNEEMFDDIMSLYDDEDDDEISKLIRKTKEVRVSDVVTEDAFNEVLDKINTQGRASLTEKEVSLLNKYSNQIKK